MTSDLKAARSAADDYHHSITEGRAETAAVRALRTCRAAVEELIERLLSEGLRLTGGLEPLATDQHIEEVRSLLGQPPPRILELFWLEVGGIQFTRDWRHCRFFQEQGIQALSDALVVDGLSTDYRQHLSNEYDAYLEVVEDWDDESGHRPTFTIPLSPDHYHKDDVSGGGDYFISLGDDDWLPYFDGFAWVGSAKPTIAPEAPDLLSYLRATILECGGFPGLYGHAKFEPMRRRLVHALPTF